MDYNGKGSLDNKDIKMKLAYKLRNFSLDMRKKPTVFDAERTKRPPIRPRGCCTKSDRVKLCQKYNT